MPLILDTDRSRRFAGNAWAADCVTVGIVNNMPDAALAATERQFVDLLQASTGGLAVRLILFAMPDMPRAGEMRREMAERYRDLAELWRTRLDGVIVTGTEPRSENLRHEPYWRTIAQLIDWSRGHTISTIWSCLAAHAAVLQADGIERRPLPEKRFGVFDCEPASEHPITRGADLPMRIPHSRWNELPEQALAACGYRIITRSAVAGVDMFARHERSFQLFLQGHPEYDSGSLLREYRRDIGRYLRGERERYPDVPHGYFSREQTALVTAFRERALVERRAELLADFPLRALETGLDGAWRRSAIGIYANWLDYLRGRKADRRPGSAPMRRVWRDWPASRKAAAS